MKLLPSAFSFSSLHCTHNHSVGHLVPPYRQARHRIHTQGNSSNNTMHKYNLQYILLNADMNIHLQSSIHKIVLHSTFRVSSNHMHIYSMQVCNIHCCPCLLQHSIRVIPPHEKDSILLRSSTRGRERKVQINV